MSNTHIGGTAYTQYFSTLTKISMLLSQLTDSLFGDEIGAVAQTAIADTLKRLEHTSIALDRKYTFSHGSLSGEELSIATSGFPNKSEIHGMFIDLHHLRDSMSRLIPAKEQKVAWLTKAVETGTDDPNLLWRIGERRYLDMLDKDLMMLPIVYGDINYLGKNSQGEARYTFWWSCYSSSSDSPAIHVLELTQDCHEEIDPLHENGPSLEAFLSVILKSGSRTPTVSLVANDIDRALAHIHPKRLTRLSMEQLYTKQSEFARRETNPKEDAVARYFEGFSEEHDVVLCMYLDVVESKGTREADDSLVNSLFGEKQRRELFHIDENPLAYERGATRSFEYLLLPHRLLQIAHSNQGTFLEPITKCTAGKKLAYTRGGKIDAIK